MIQDIEPKRFRNEFYIKDAKEMDYLICYDKDSLLCAVEGDWMHLPTVQQLGADMKDCTFLFSIDDDDFFLWRGDLMPENGEFHYEKNTILRTCLPRYTAFAGFVGYHLANWYKDNVFCGRCGEKLTADTKERMMKCEKCGNMIYPKICPGVIVAIVNGDKLLMSKYAGRAYANYALIAGFTEIGESLEKTVEREVMEEVGLKVKNITFYKSQPWAFSSSLLAGFYAELDGDDTITLDKNELALAGWYTADEIDVQPDQMSLTREMMIRFKNGEHPFAKK